MAKAAIFHAQLETIHPFMDGNGRTGRTLLHRMLASDEVLLHTMLPVSAGLLHDVDATGAPSTPITVGRQSL